MTKQDDVPILRNRIHQYRSYIPPLPVLSALAIIAVGGGVLLALPEGGDRPQIASSETTGAQPAFDDSRCDKQAWPYIDQRCAESVEKARATRQVRIVTDDGTFVTVMAPLPSVVAKPKPAPQATVVAQNDRPIGPPVVAPTVADHTPQAETVAAIASPSAPAPKAVPAAEPAPAVQTAAAPSAPAETAAMARDNSRTSPETLPAGKLQNASLAAPAAASAVPVAPGVDALDEVRPKKLTAAEKREARLQAREAKREARREARRQRMERAVPDDVVVTVRNLPVGRQGARRGRNAVPDEVVAAVEMATAGERRSRVVAVGSPYGGERIYIVPRGGW